MKVRDNHIALPCRISPGVFSGDRSLEVTLANGDTYKTLVPRYHLWDDRGTPIGPTVNQQTINGLVAAIVIELIEDDQYLVELPDGDVVAVERSQAVQRPAAGSLGTAGASDSRDVVSK